MRKEDSGISRWNQDSGSQSLCASESPGGSVKTQTTELPLQVSASVVCDGNQECALLTSFQKMLMLLARSYTSEYH